jgi:hypothetical protein
MNTEGMAMNYLGDLIAVERSKRGWRYGDLARACGAVTPKEVSKTALRLVLFERESVRDGSLLKKVIAALGLDVELVRALQHREREESVAEWERWADEPVRPELACKAGPIWITRPVPETITTEQEAVEYTTEFVRKHRFFPFVVLVYDRRIRHYFEQGTYNGRSEATPESSQAPHMSVGGTPFIFKVDGDQ